MFPHPSRRWTWEVVRRPAAPSRKLRNEMYRINLIQVRISTMLASCSAKVWGPEELKNLPDPAEKP